MRRINIIETDTDVFNAGHKNYFKNPNGLLFCKEKKNLSSEILFDEKRQIYLKTFRMGTFVL